METLSMKIKINYTGDFVYQLNQGLYFATSSPATFSYISSFYDVLELKLDKIISYTVADIDFEELYIPLDYNK